MTIQEDAQAACEKYRTVIDHLYQFNGADADTAKIILKCAGEIE